MVSRTLARPRPSRNSTVSWPGWAVRIGTIVLEVIGWIITALGAAAVTGIIKRDRG